MSFLTIDAEKCGRDGLCAAACPVTLLEMKGKDSPPVPIPGAEELCIACGHCVAVCPHGALSLQTMRSEECPPVKKELLIGPEQTEHFLRYRRSIRRYRSKPVDRETLTRLIEMARYAPSGHNLQPVHWLVIQGADEIRCYAGIVIDWMRVMIKSQVPLVQTYHLDLVVADWEQGHDRVLRNAPHLIVAHADQSLTVAQSSCTIALTYMELAAVSLGLGACWAGYFNAAAGLYPPMMEALDLPQGHQCFGAMMVGYPKYAYARLPLRKPPSITWR